MIIYKQKVEAGIPFFAPREIVGFGHDGHRTLSVWFVEDEAKFEFKVVGTGEEYDDAWMPVKLMAISTGGYVWHLLKKK